MPMVDDNQDLEAVIAAIPTIKYYQKTYAGSLGNEDQKAVRVFKDYESHEKFNRLRQELIWVRDDMVRPEPCSEVIGLKRKARYGSFSRWASLMLQWMAALK